MFSFEGNYRTKRSQVFDRTEKVTADTIIQKMREERQKRELVRRQHKAATKIQALCRGMLCRCLLERTFGLELQERSNALLAFSSSDESLMKYNQQLVSVLCRFNWCCRRKIKKEPLLVICRLLLSQPGSMVTTSWLGQSLSDPLRTLTRTLQILLSYLGSLPAQSPSEDYVLPVRCLENILISSSRTCIGTQEPVSTMQENFAWLYLELARHRYFRLLAQFTDRQVPISAGFLTNMTDPNSRTAFDPVEFAKPAKTRSLLELLLAPVKWVSSCSPTHTSALMEDVLVYALNDMLVSDGSTYTVNERIVRGMGTRLFDSSLAMLTLVRVCLSCTTDASSRKLIPSLNLLYLLVTVVLPHLLRGSDSSASLPPQPSEEMDVDKPHDSEAERPLMFTDLSLPDAHLVSTASTMTGHVAAEAVRCIAWLLIPTIVVPGLPCCRPLKPPAPLVAQSVDSEQSDSEVDEDEDNTIDAQAGKGVQAFMARSNESQVFRSASKVIAQAAAHTPTWDTELLEILIFIRRTLPSLATQAISELESNSPIDFNPDSSSNEQLNLVRALAQLHYVISQVNGVSTASMIPLNSIYSRHLVFLRVLWHLVQHSRATVSRPEMGTSVWEYSLFPTLCAGECPPQAIMPELQIYLPMLFTFVDCLHHRLLCLTDAEICGDDFDQGRKNIANLGCGFRADELLQIGAKLRDLMLGLIDLSHPDQLPKYNPQYFCASQLLSSNDTGRSDAPTFREVLDRIELRAEAVAAGASPDSFALTRQRFGWPPQDMRLQLHCWTALFRHVQRLVFQIYDWDRRCHRQSLIQSDMGALSSIHSSLPTIMKNSGRLSCIEPSGSSQAFWLKESIATAIDSSIKSWLQHGGDRNSLTLAGLPFGYYSRLNPDRNQADVPFMLSNREVRQVLIFKELPFVIPFERRVRLFQLLVTSTRTSAQTSHTPIPVSGEQRPSVMLLVRRTHLYEDAFEKLSKENAPNLQSRLQVRFMNQVGAEEVGVDGGGLSREFLSELIKTGFDPTRGFFIYTAEKTLYPNPQAAVLSEDYLKHYYFLGRMLGKAIYEGMLVELQFAHFFLAKIASRSGGGVGFDYLHSLDPELYRQLRYLKSYEGNIRDLSLDFTVVQSTFGESETVELKPGGRHIPVTEENRVEYMHLMAYYKLNKQIHSQVRAFVAGMNDVICIDWLRLFDADELQTLISGADMVIDIDDLRKHTVYLAGTTERTETLEHFWNVLGSLSEADKRLFLRFVTSCSRPPMFGFRDMVPPFCLQITDELDRLPTASTCINLLRLPDFRDPEVLRERLLYALHANAGFEYS